jgi:hypothetical protein
MAASDNNAVMRRFTLSNWKFRLILSKQLIAFCDEHSVNIVRKQELAISASKSHGHYPGSVPKGFRGMCCVCCLEEGFQSIFRKEKRATELASILETSPDTILNQGLYSVRKIAGCSNKECSLHAHSISVASNNFIFKHRQLVGLTCFEIAHHPVAEGLWKSNSSLAMSLGGSIRLSFLSGQTTPFISMCAANMDWIKKEEKS